VAKHLLYTKDILGSIPGVGKYISWSRDSSTRIVIRLQLDDRGIEVRFPAGARDLSLLQGVHTGSGTRPAVDLTGTEFSFPEDKVGGRGS
jgi:hypothetical protein